MNYNYYTAAEKIKGDVSLWTWTKYLNYLNFSKNRDMDIMRIFDYSNYIQKYSHTNKNILCDHCGSESFNKISNGRYKCIECDVIQERVYEVPNYIGTEKNYKKIIHYLTHLNNFLVINPPKIPERDMKKIRQSVQYMAYGDNLKPPDIYNILKKHKMSKYYPHYIYIYCVITDKPFPSIEARDIELMKMMFKEIDSAWKDCKMNPRDSLINYLFTLKKILELIGNYDHYLCYLKISNSYTNLRELDLKWMKLCEFLNYEYIPTV